MNLAWDPPSTTPVVGYRVYYGRASGNYTNLVDAGTATSIRISNLVEGVTYYFAATSRDALGLESTFSGELLYSVPASNSIPNDVPVFNPGGTVHYDFTSANRASLVADGWDFIARTASGSARNTEQTTGALVFYDQVARPGVLRIPADTGDLWAAYNNTRNSLFRNLPSNWTSIRVKLAFAPTRDWQQASIVAYQDDDNYLQVTREYNAGNAVTFVSEVGGRAAGIRSAAVSATSNLHLRLDRDAATRTFKAYYSLNGTSWISLSNVVQTLNNPRFGIVVGSSPGGYPNADISWVEIDTPTIAPALSVSPATLTFSTGSGTVPATQFMGVTNVGGGTWNWTAQADTASPSWLSLTPGSGTGDGKIAVSVASVSLPPGNYTKTITVSAAGATNSPRIVTVNLAVTNSVVVSNPAPVIVLTSPANGAGYAAPATINLAATVTPNGHTINKVQFFNGTTLLRERAFAPYSFSWSNTPAGTYNLSARALYDGTASVDSAVSRINVSGLLTPWQTTDIGAVAAAGSASVSNSLYTVTGAGKTSGSDDSFRFVYQPLSADGDIKARIHSVQGGSGARFGVMIRESLTSGSRYALMSISPDGQFRWQRRSTTKGATYVTTSGSGVPPNAWVRLTRTGDTINGYRSTDGVNWTRVSSRSISMAANIYIGLAVASDISNVLSTATFTNVVVIP